MKIFGRLVNFLFAIFRGKKVNLIITFDANEKQKEVIHEIATHIGYVMDVMGLNFDKDIRAVLSGDYIFIYANPVLNKREVDEEDALPRYNLELHQVEGLELLHSPELIIRIPYLIYAITVEGVLYKGDAVGLMKRAVANESDKRFDAMLREVEKKFRGASEKPLRDF